MVEGFLVWGWVRGGQVSTGDDTEGGMELGLRALERFQLARRGF